MFIRIFGVIVSGLVATSAGCSATDLSSSIDGDASAEIGVDVGADASTIDASIDLGAPLPVPEAGYNPFDALAYDVAPPPIVVCHANDAGVRDATVVGDGEVDATPIDPQCPLPPSVCASASVLIYYEGGTCVGSTCSYTASVLLCAGPCHDGGCTGAPTVH